VNQTGICNLALIRQGISTQIAALTDNTPAANACRAVFEQCVRKMLEERPWPFATRQVSLSLVGTQIFSNWLYTYRHPTGYLNIHTVNPPIVGTTTPAEVYVENDRAPVAETFPFKKGSDASGLLIHTDVTDAIAMGTVYISDTSIYSPMFCSALAWHIASETAVVLTKNREIKLMASAEYDREVSEAFATSANETKPRKSPEAEMIQARL